ncbi:GNAT family N-acetyltransferase [Chitinophaga oryziterrae]|uniref:GNAT family N-acetyltransferase n=1 Tax=Chitinophaga oryziterrae TaxID=1031224 RepID=A0A6N8J4I9_9BACT|nr:GNAT family N-acetyltransferase [Chitinophaga oryziterrae]MVT39072.1 GNAT family N-acetyltransferase [Chitinophaga oryziterrae]
MKIEKIGLTDIPELTDLINSAYKGGDSENGWTSEGHLVEGSRVNEQMIIKYLDNKDVTILKLTDETNRIIGSVYLETKGSSKLYLGMLSVSPSVQNKGVGRILLEESENFAKQHHRNVITISVISVRTELISWYERRGFIKSGKLLPFPTNVGNPKTPLELVEMEKAV